MSKLSAIEENATVQTASSAGSSLPFNCHVAVLHTVQYRLCAFSQWSRIATRLPELEGCDSLPHLHANFLGNSMDMTNSIPPFGSARPVRAGS